jgi:hypothetical protein
VEREPGADGDAGRREEGLLLIPHPWGLSCSSSG